MQLFMFACFTLWGWFSLNFLIIARFSAETRHSKSQSKKDVFLLVTSYDYLKITYYSSVHILKFSCLRSLYISNFITLLHALA